MVKGSYTVELSILSPFILGIVIFILYETFYFYNAGVMKAMAFSTALEASCYEDYSMERQEAILENLGQKKIEGKLFGMGDVSTFISINNSSCTVGYEGKLSLPFLSGSFLPDASLWTISVEEKSKVSKPREWIQNVRRIQKLGEKWVGEE